MTDPRIEAMAQARRKVLGKRTLPDDVDAKLVAALPEGWVLTDGSDAVDAGQAGFDAGVQQEREPYARLVQDAADVDDRLYLTDPVYHGIVKRIHRGARP